MLNETNVPPSLLTGLGVYLTVAGVLGGMFNGVALYVFFTNRQIRSPTNIFIIGLLVCDFCMCVIGIPLPAVSNLAHDWQFGWPDCVFHAFSVYFFGLSNMYILTAISVNRYIIIVKPPHTKGVNYRFSAVALITCYVLGFLWSAMPLFGWSSFVYEGSGTSCAISYAYYNLSAFSYNITITINCYCIPIIIMAVCYSNIFRAVRNSKMTIGKSNAERNMLSEKKLAKIFVIMIGKYLFCWTPYAIASFWEAFGFGDLPVLVATIPSMFAKSASVWNPLVYAYMNTQFKKVLCKKIPCLKLLVKERKHSREYIQSDGMATMGRKSTFISRPHERSTSGLQVCPTPAVVDQNEVGKLASSGSSVGEICIETRINVNETHTLMLDSKI